jgi:hypothetical protein
VRCLGDNLIDDSCRFYDLCKLDTPWVFDGSSPTAQGSSISIGNQSDHTNSSRLFIAGDGPMTGTELSVTTTAIISSYGMRIFIWRRSQLPHERH